MKNGFTLSAMRNNPLYLSSLLLHGNSKLLDYTDDGGHIYRYAQFNTRPIIDCPCKSEGCKAVCYATKGNHVFPSVKNSREKSYQDSKRKDFTQAMIYTISTEQLSARYKNATMIIRIHESGDFYSVQYLRRWLMVWKHFEYDSRVHFVFYTKSFPFFLMLTDTEKAMLRMLMKRGRVAMNLSMDDTTTAEQKKAYLQMIKEFPLANTYYCTEHVNNVEHDNICDCENCAKCGTCNKATGKKTVVKIHSASNADMDVYRANIG